MDYTWAVNITLKAYPDGCRLADIEIDNTNGTLRTSFKLPLHSGVYGALAALVPLLDDRLGDFFVTQLEPETWEEDPAS